MDKQKAIGLIKELHRIWNTGDLDAIPNVYSPDFIGHWPKGWGTGDIYGYEGICATIQRSRKTFPDWHEKIVDLIVGDDRVVTRYTSTGTHQGEYIGVPGTGKQVEFEEISIYRIVEDDNLNLLVVEQWCLGDDIHCKNQLSEK